MRGHIYKNFSLCRGNVIFIAVMQALISATVIILTVFVRDNISGEYSIGCAVSYALMPFLTAFSYTEYFKCDEQQTWVCFTASTPQGFRGHVAGKYCTVLIINLAVLCCNLLTDLTAAAILGTAEHIMPEVLILLFSAETVICAFEMVVYIRFGSEAGSAVKGAVVGVIISGLIVYLLFGDVSFLFSDDPLAELLEILSHPVPIWAALIITLTSLGLYALSYAASLRLFRKGAESYGE